MLGSESTFRAITRVFFRLMVSPKSCKAFLKRFMSCWRSSVEWAVMAASSAKGKSGRHFIWTLLLVWKGWRDFRLIWSGDRCPLLQLQSLVSAGQRRKPEIRSVLRRSPASLHSRCRKGLMLSRQRRKRPLLVFLKGSNYAEPGWTSDFGQIKAFVRSMKAAKRVRLGIQNYIVTEQCRLENI